MKKPLISLCVPTYNRPDTLSQLIRSYDLQTYSNKELVISDDSTTDDVEKLVASLKRKDIRYFRNSPPLGFPKNLLASMLRASGDFILTLGDDDILFSEKSLQRYVNVFTKHVDVHFVYSNQIQFNDSGKVEADIKKFSRTTIYSAGDNSMNAMFLHSIFIGGQGFRRVDNLKSLYPKKNILHPQVQLVGSLLAQYKSCGLSEYCVGVRSHEDQIIFRALKNKKIQMQGEHMNIELPQIYKSLIKKYKLKDNTKHIIQQLINNYPTALIKEKIYLGNTTVRKYYEMFTSQSPSANESLKLKAMYVCAIVTPAFALTLLRSLAIYTYQFYNRRSFTLLETKLRNILNTNENSILPSPLRPAKR